MNKISIRQGETLPLEFEVDETGADTLTLTVSLDGDVVLSKSTGFDGLTASLTLTSDETDINVGEYSYMFTVTYDDGTVEKYPDSSQCEDCELPILEICVANDEPGSS